MIFEDYLLYLNGTVDNYSSKVKKHLRSTLLKNGVAYEKCQLRIDDIANESAIDISEMQLSDQIKSCFKQSKEAVSYFENWEFEKDYKYSVLFDTEKFDELLKQANMIDENKEENENNSLYSSFNSPIKYDTQQILFLKFNLKFSAIHPLTEQELLLKYPFVVAIHKDEKIVELRFDVVKRVFLSEKKEQTIYSDLVKSMRNYFKLKLNCDLVPLDLDFMVTEAKEQREVKLIAQYMKLASGGNAQLEVGNNQEYVIPFIGELKALLVDYKTELEKIPSVKDALDQFIFEKEEMSDYPWIEVLWENEIKTRSIRVKFIFNYTDNDYCLIQHYYNSVLIGMERMNHVIKFISQHRENN